MTCRKVQSGKDLCLSVCVVLTLWDHELGLSLTLAGSRHLDFDKFILKFGGECGVLGYILPIKKRSSCTKKKEI